MNLYCIEFSSPGRSQMYSSSEYNIFALGKTYDEAVAKAKEYLWNKVDGQPVTDYDGSLKVRNASELEVRAVRMITDFVK